MDGQIFQEIGLDQIMPNPMNPRKRFDGRKFDELVESVKAKGVIEPILVRPKDDVFEIVAGERRFRAAIRVAEGNGGPESHTIPAMIRDLNDDDAFDLMCIENLQREDLTELEEAESFRMYVKKHGDGCIPQLAERTGIDQKYIRRRLAVLKLPKKALKAWAKGDLKYGHLEQLLRLDDEKKICDLVERANDQWYGAMTVRQMKNEIDLKAIKLKDAKFDLEKAGCLQCLKNTETKKELYAVGDIDGAHCLDPKCFKQAMNNWLQTTWTKTGYRKHYGTNGFRFSEDLEYREKQNVFRSKAPKRCGECEKFVTLIYLDGRTYEGQVCIGDKDCFNRSKKKRETSGSGEKTEVRQPPAWHGEYFREEFYKEQLPLRLREESADDVKTLRIALFSLLKSNPSLYGWFGKMHKIKAVDDEEYDKENAEFYDGYTFLEDADLWKAIESLDMGKVLSNLQEGSIRTVMKRDFGALSRRLVADHVGISLQEEWRITEEYLQKKTVPEIKAIAEKFKLFERQEAKTFLYEVLLKKRGNFNTCKKSELIRIFLWSGMDLKGVVPEEILKT